MVVSAVEPVKTHSGNGSDTTFDFPFLINTESELVVKYTDSNGNQTTLTLNTDYSINEVGNKNGSYITFPLSTSSHSVLATGEKISNILDLPAKQEVQYDPSKDLSLPALENSLDYLTRIEQIQNRELERCVKVPEGSATDPDVLISSLETSATNAASSATAAATAATNASNSATTAGTSATAAANSAAQAAIYAQQLQQSSVTYTATIGTNWNGTSAPFTQDVAVSGILATDNAVVGLVQSDTFATAQIQRQEYSKIFRAVSSTDKVTFYANAPTTSAIAVQLKIVR